MSISITTHSGNAQFLNKLW